MEERLLGFRTASLGFRSMLRRYVFGETDLRSEDRELGTSFVEGLGLILGSERHRPSREVAGGRRCMEAR